MSKEEKEKYLGQLDYFLDVHKKYPEEVAEIANLLFGDDYNDIERLVDTLNDARFSRFVINSLVERLAQLTGKSGIGDLEEDLFGDIDLEDDYDFLGDDSVEFDENDFYDEDK